MLKTEIYTGDGFILAINYRHYYTIGNNRTAYDDHLSRYEIACEEGQDENAIAKFENTQCECRNEIVSFQFFDVIPLDDYVEMSAVSAIKSEYLDAYMENYEELENTSFITSFHKTQNQEK